MKLRNTPTIRRAIKTSKKYLQQRSRVIATAVALTVGYDYSRDIINETEITQISGEEADKEKLLTIEELKEGYEKIALRRDTYAPMGATRYEILTKASFVSHWMPRLASMNLKSTDTVTFDALEKIGIPKEKLVYLTDLSAFPRNKLLDGTLDFSKLKAQGVKEIVLMEDRAPQFFLNYDGYNENGIVPLNRHGDLNEQWTMKDLKKLVELARAQGIKFIIGFWGNTADKDNNAFVKNNWEALKPVIPFSDDLNPLSMVKDQQGNEMTFADYIIKQYIRLQKDFGLEGLFLGDGLMGFRSFLDPEGPYDTSDFAYLWTDFYRRISEGIKKANPDTSFWAYDVMGNGPTKAKKNGVYLPAIIRQLDRYVAQMYSIDAWGRNYMRLPGYDLERDATQLIELFNSLPPEERKKILYAAGFGDKVEHWGSTLKDMREKHQRLHQYALGGILGVWSNDLIRETLLN